MDTIRQEFQAKRMKNLTKVFSKYPKAESVQYMYYHKQVYSYVTQAIILKMREMSSSMPNTISAMYGRFSKERYNPLSHDVVTADVITYLDKQLL